MIWLIIWLVSFLPTSSAAVLSNENLYLINYAVVQAREEVIDGKKFVELIRCESDFNPLAQGDYQIETNTYLSKGILQFQKGTWDMYSKRYNHIGTWLNPYSQISLAVKIIGKEKDGIYHWKNCGLKIGLIKNVKLSPSFAGRNQ